MDSPHRVHATVLLHLRFEVLQPLRDGGVIRGHAILNKRRGDKRGQPRFAGSRGGPEAPVILLRAFEISQRLIDDGFHVVGAWRSPGERGA